MHLDGEYIKGDIDNYNLSVIIYNLSIFVSHGSAFKR